MGNPQRPFRHRAAAMFLAVWFVLLSLAFPQRAWAMLVEDVILEGFAAKQMIREDVQRAMKDSFGFQAQLALINALQFFGERLAY